MSSTDDLRALDQAHVWHPFTDNDAWQADAPLVIDRADGCWLYDTDGNRYLDANASLWVNVHGHRHPALDAALLTQVKKVAHTTFLGLSNPAAATLAARLAKLAPPGLERVFFSESGASAVEVALKMAYGYWCAQDQPQRSLYVAMDGAYHGDTIGSVSVGRIDAFHAAYGPLLFPTRGFAQPYCYRCPLQLTYPSCNVACADTLSEVFLREGDRVGAVIIEPLVQGAAGIITAPDGHLARVADLTRAHGALLIADEVATGFGRTGTMFACEAEGIAPDLMSLGKGLTGGYLPMSATLATTAVYDAFTGGNTFFHGHSYSGNPLAAAVALANLDLFADPQTLTMARELGAVLEHEFARLRVLTGVGDIRRRGTMAGIELVADVTTGNPFDPALRIGAQVCRRARDLGVVIRPLGDTIVVLPALTMTAAQVSLLVDVLCQAIPEITAAAEAGTPGE